MNPLQTGSSSHREFELVAGSGKSGSRASIVVSCRSLVRMSSTPPTERTSSAAAIEGEVTAIDLGEGTVGYDVGPRRRPQRISFDYLLLAPGSVTNFFGMADVAENASTMRTLADAALLRNWMVTLLEDAATEPDEAVRRRLTSPGWRRSSGSASRASWRGGCGDPCTRRSCRVPPGRSAS